MEEKLDVGYYMPSIQELYNPQGIVEQETEIVAKETFRDRNIINPAPQPQQSQYQSPRRNQFVSPSKTVFEQRVQGKGLTVTGNKNLYQSQTDKRSVHLFIPNGQCLK